MFIAGASAGAGVAAGVDDDVVVVVVVVVDGGGGGGEQAIVATMKMPARVRRDFMPNLLR